MSGGDTWARTDPSTNSTNEWTIDSGWMTTSIRSGGRPNSQRASITSSALFISVAESTVIFGPIRQVGWAGPLRRLRRRNCVSFRPRNGPPLPVSTTRSTAGGDSRRSPGRWRCARCPPGGVGPARRFARSMTSCPATTSVSLFASATVLPASRAAQVYSSPAAPTMAETTTSTSGACTRRATSSDGRTDIRRRRGARRVHSARLARPPIAAELAPRLGEQIVVPAGGRPVRRLRTGRAGRRPRRACWSRSTRWSRARPDAGAAAYTCVGFVGGLVTHAFGKDLIHRGILRFGAPKSQLVGGAKRNRAICSLGRDH